MPRRSKQLVKQDFKPGIIGWVRRRVLPILAKGTALLGILMLGAWITGRVLTDEHHWSQYVYWLPPIVMIGGAWAMLVLSAIFAAMARRLGGLLLRPVLLLLAIGCTIHLVFGVWHLHRAIFHDRTKSPGAVRVIHQNFAGKEGHAPSFGEQARALDADIVLLANVQWGEARQEVLEQFAYFAPDERVRWVNYSYRLHANPAHYRVEGDALIASRYPMTRTGMVSFGSRQRQQVLSHSSSGKGWAMFAEFDLDPERTDDAPFVAWFVDLPSNPTAWKMESMREVRREIDAWKCTGWAMGRHVWEQRTFENESFPTPDLIIGDFNTPRGSASIDQIAPGYADAFKAAGYGRGRSFVIKDGSWSENLMFRVLDMHIDLAMTRPGIRVERYELIGEPIADHAMQVIDLIP
jgi:hypothetical protein